jgi:hypothetical protein
MSGIKVRERSEGGAADLLARLGGLSPVDVGGAGGGCGNDFMLDCGVQDDLAWGKRFSCDVKSGKVCFLFHVVFAGSIGDGNVKWDAEYDSGERHGVPTNPLFCAVFLLRRLCFEFFSVFLISIYLRLSFPGPNYSDGMAAPRSALLTQHNC